MEGTGRPRVRPAYGAASLVNVTASIAGHFGLATAHPPLGDALDVGGATRLIFLLCDALGALELETHLAQGALPRLARLLAEGDARMGRITSVFPSTTAAALSSIHTGRTPAEHGYLGYSLWLGSGPEVTACGVTCRVVNSAAFAQSALSAWHFAGAEYRRWYSANTLPSLLADAAATVTPTYIWTYWPAHDHVCHVHGPRSREAADELAVLDLVLDRIIGRLPRDGRTLMLACGDHGQRTLDPARAVFLDDIVPHPTAGERTALYLRAEPGVAERLGDLAEVVEMDRL